MISRYATRLKFARACAERPEAWEEVRNAELQGLNQGGVFPDPNFKGH